ncbi:hypothetical protein THAOC_20785, partial [Thalassiosira oceanica]
WASAAASPEARSPVVRPSRLLCIHPVETVSEDVASQLAAHPPSCSRRGPPDELSPPERPQSRGPGGHVWRRESGSDPSSGRPPLSRMKSSPQVAGRAAKPSERSMHVADAPVLRLCRRSPRPRRSPNDDVARADEGAGSVTDTASTRLRLSRSGTKSESLEYTTRTPMHGSGGGESLPPRRGVYPVTLSARPGRSGGARSEPPVGRLDHRVARRRRGRPRRTPPSGHGKRSFRPRA